MTCTITTLPALLLKPRWSPVDLTHFPLLPPSHNPLRLWLILMWDCCFFLFVEHILMRIAPHSLCSVDVCHPSPVRQYWKQNSICGGGRLLIECDSVSGGGGMSHKAFGMFWTRKRNQPHTSQTKTTRLVFTSPCCNSQTVLADLYSLFLAIEIDSCKSAAFVSRSRGHWMSFTYLFRTHNTLSLFLYCQKGVLHQERSGYWIYWVVNTKWAHTNILNNKRSLISFGNIINTRLGESRERHNTRLASNNYKSSDAQKETGLYQKRSAQEILVWWVTVKWWKNERYELPV